MTLLVVGDAFLDRDIHGEAHRLCPDAPAVVVDQHHVTERPGGAGLAACLARQHCDDVRLLTATGRDDAGIRLRHLLESAGVELVASDTVASTVQKTRVMVDGRPLVRVDAGGTETVGSLDWAGHDDAIDGEVDSVLVADYGLGVAETRRVRGLLTRMLERGVPLVWDPHPRGHAPIPGTTLVTPSRAEAAVMAAGFESHGADESGLAAVARQGRTLVRHWKVDGAAVTIGAGGAVLVRSAGAPLVVPVVQPTRGGDACGAGDAFSAACAIAFGNGAVASEAVEQAVQVAAAFVARGGASHVIAGGAGDPRADRSPATRPGTVVAAGGCFDVLHAGHVRMLQQARSLGERLVVLMNSDASVTRLKGPGRPVNPMHDRVAVLRALDCVDEVVVFDEDTPNEVLRRIRPAIFVKGGDYSSIALPEEAILAEWGGTVVTVPYLAGRSTTLLLGRGAPAAPAAADG